MRTKTKRDMAPKGAIANKPSSRASQRMSRTSREEAQKRYEFARQQWRADPSISAPKMQELLKKTFGTKLNNQNIYKLRNEVWTELHIPLNSRADSVQLLMEQRRSGNPQGSVSAQLEAHRPQHVSTSHSTSRQPHRSMDAAGDAEPVVIQFNDSQSAAEVIVHVFDKLRDRGYCDFHVEATASWVIVHRP